MEDEAGSVVIVEEVVVRYAAIGGAFGGREDMSIQIVLALAAWKLQRPVKIIYDRAEDIAIARGVAIGAGM